MSGHNVSEWEVVGRKGKGRLRSQNTASSADSRRTKDGAQAGRTATRGYTHEALPGWGYSNGEDRLGWGEATEAASSLSDLAAHQAPTPSSSLNEWQRVRGSGRGGSQRRGKRSPAQGGGENAGGHGAQPLAPHIPQAHSHELSAAEQQQVSALLKQILELRWAAGISLTRCVQQGPATGVPCRCGLDAACTGTSRSRVSGEHLLSVARLRLWSMPPDSRRVVVAGSAFFSSLRAAWAGLAPLLQRSPTGTATEGAGRGDGHRGEEFCSG
jgi:hypothetical protein